MMIEQMLVRAEYRSLAALDLSGLVT